MDIFSTVASSMKLEPSPFSKDLFKQRADSSRTVESLTVKFNNFVSINNYLQVDLSQNSIQILSQLSRLNCPLCVLNFPFTLMCHVCDSFEKKTFRFDQIRRNELEESLVQLLRESK